MRFLSRGNDVSHASNSQPAPDTSHTPIPSDVSLQTASTLQSRAELWQDLARQQQDVAALLQRAALHQREIISRATEEERESLSPSGEYRQFEEEILKLVAAALSLEEHALARAEQATRQTHDILEASARTHAE